MPTKALAAARAMLAQIDPSTGRRIANARDSPALFVREYFRAGGLRLNPKIWRQDAAALQAVTDAIAEALTNGYGADKAVAYFVAGGGRGEAALLESTSAWQSSFEPRRDRVVALFVREMNRAYEEVNRANSL